MLRHSRRFRSSEPPALQLHSPYTFAPRDKQPLAFGLSNHAYRRILQSLLKNAQRSRRDSLSRLAFGVSKHRLKILPPAEAVIYQKLNPLLTNQLTKKNRKADHCLTLQVFSRPSASSQGISLPIICPGPCAQPGKS